MAQSFNPYHRWLGIPLKDQPANHYRLLSIEQFENDPEVIHDAAERQMAHVRRYELGQHVELSQRILNELAEAGACLSDPQKKALYDKQLRASLKPAATKVLPTAVPLPEGTHPEPLRPIPRQPTSELKPALHPPLPRRLPNGVSPAVLGGITVAAAILVIVLAVKWLSAPSEIAQQPHESDEVRVSQQGPASGQTPQVATEPTPVQSIQPQHPGQDKGEEPGSPELPIGKASVAEPAPGQGSSPSIPTGPTGAGSARIEEPPAASPPTETIIPSEAPPSPFARPATPPVPSSAAVALNATLTRARTALERRDVATARSEIGHAIAAEGGTPSNPSITRVKLLTDYVERFWVGVQSAIDELGANSQVVGGLKIQRVRGISGTELMEYNEGGFGLTKSHTLKNMPGSLALALATQKLNPQEGTDLVAVGAFHAVDFDGDPSGAVVMWDRAAYKGKQQDVAILWPELEAGFQEGVIPSTPWQLTLPSGKQLYRGQFSADLVSHLSTASEVPTADFDFGEGSHVATGFDFKWKRPVGPVAGWYSDNQPMFMASLNSRNKLDGDLYFWNAKGERVLCEHYINDRPGGGVTCLFRDDKPWLVLEYDKTTVTSASIVAGLAVRKNYSSLDELAGGADSHVLKALETARDGFTSRMAEVKSALREQIEENRAAMAARNSVQGRQAILSSIQQKAEQRSQAMGAYRKKTSNASQSGGYR